MRSDIPVLDSVVLLVDDDPLSLRLLSEILRMEGFCNVLSTTDPREVDDLCSAHDVDLIVLDIYMPYLNGFQVMARLQENDETAEIPIIVISALSDTETCNRVWENGAWDFLLKPFNHREVLSRIRNALQARLLYKQVRSNNERLERQIEERSREIYHTRLKIIHRLSRAAEYRDNETGMHILRMSRYSMLLARGIGMSEKDCEVILHASPLHDIGKIGIPDSILLKQGRLSAGEWEIMKGHTLIGVKILDGDDCEFLEAARTIALGHHEKWDGSGYPHGRKGEAIPLMARIVAVADVFDALTSQRPYKEAWSMAHAFDYIRSEKGGHFDPLLAECFLDLAPQLAEVRARYAEVDEPAFPARLEVDYRSSGSLPLRT